MRDAIFLFDPKKSREVYVVPNFISEGYFTQTVIPRELELSGRVTARANGQVWKYCEPIWDQIRSDPRFQELAEEKKP